MNVRPVLMRVLSGLLVLAFAVLVGGCKGKEPSESGAAPDTAGGEAATPTTPVATTELPEVEYSDLPFKLQMKIGAARQDARNAPDDALKVAGLGALYYVHGFPQAAVTCFARATELRPEEFVLWYSLALTHERAGNQTQAAEAYRRALKISTDYEPAQRRLARLLEAQGKDSEAAQYRQQSSRSDDAVLEMDLLARSLLRRGLDLDVLLEDVRMFAQAGRLAQAEALLQDALAVDEVGVRSRAIRGALLALQGRTDEALRELRAVLEEDPENLPAKLDLARVLAMTGETADAERLLQEILGVQPADLSALAGYCQLMAGQQRQAEALTAVHRAQESAGDDAELQLELAELLAKLDQQDEAIEAVRRVVASNPNMARARYMLGMFLFSSGDRAGAEREWTKATQVAPKYLAAWLALFESQYQEQEYAPAEKILRAALEQLPKSEALAHRLAWLLAASPLEEQRDGEEAIEWAEKACQSNNYTDRAMLDTLAAAYAEAGRFDDARKWIAEAIKLSRAANDLAQVQEYEQRQATYKEGKPYHMSE